MLLYHSEIIYGPAFVQISISLRTDDQSSQVQAPELETLNAKKPLPEEKSEVKGMIFLFLVFANIIRLLCYILFEFVLCIYFR